MTTKAKLYMTDTCPECHALLNLLRTIDVLEVQQLNMADPEDRAEAVCEDGMMELSLPVLQIGNHPFLLRRILVNEKTGLRVNEIKELIEKMIKADFIVSEFPSQ